MKKIIALCLVVLLVATAVACAKKPKQTTTAKQDSTAHSIVSEQETITLADEDVFDTVPVQFEDGEDAGDNTSKQSGSSGKSGDTTTTKKSGNSSTTKKSGGETTSMGEDITYHEDGSFDTPIIPIG